MRCRFVGCTVLGLAVGLGLSAWVCAAEGERRQPVFVGTKVCGSCHDGPGMGYQYSQWMLTKHAHAYAALSKPESKKIAELSGIPQDPTQAPMCLGCHATGAHAEKWEKDDTFSVQEGVQCEKCHGPGSEYMDLSVMTNHEAAVKAGLQTPTMRECMNCHQTKGSHVAVLKQPALDLEKAWKEIAHPTPEKWEMPKPVALPKATATQDSAPKYTGSAACAECHDGPDMGYQFSKWRLSAHADAFAVLATAKAKPLAQAMGVRGDPQREPACLKCHATAYHDPAGGALDSYALHEGVGCEACHGAGSEYSPEAIMRDKRGAKQAGLKDVRRETCLACHENAHGKPFDYDKSLATIAHPTKLPAVSVGPRYKTPLNLAMRPDGRELYVACESADSVIVVDVVQRRKVGEISTGRQPAMVCFSPDGARAYVSNRLDDSVAVIDVAGRKVVANVAVGDEPHGVRTDLSGKTLYVLNTSSDDISVVDTVALKEVKRLAASRGPWALALSPDGTQILATNTLSRFVPFRKPSMSEVTVIDTERVVVDDRIVLPATNLLQGVAWHPSGKYALVTMLRTKNLVPMTRLMQGWTITNGLGIVWRDGRVDQVLLDEPSECFPDPTDVAITPDGRLALVTSASTHRVAVVDLAKLCGMLEAASPEERERVLPNHLGKPTEFVVAHIATKDSPRGIVIAPDGKAAFVANSLDDSLTAIDLTTLKAVGRVDLGGPKMITQVRYGERVFNDAGKTYHRQFSCHTCHPDGHIDGITYNTEPGGVGTNPVDNRTLRGILDTAPFKWEGTNPSLQRQCGARLAVFFTRIEPFEPAEVEAIEAYLCTIPRPPNRYRPLGAELTDAQRRGKANFERTRTNDGREIPLEKRCEYCHFPPLYTDRQRHDVGTKMALDTQGRFDVPHLNNIYDSAPYLHNGMAETLEEIWTRYNPYDQHGVTNDMTKDQLNDLIEYLKTL